jgi:hypothetical protein
MPDPNRQRPEFASIGGEDIANRSVRFRAGARQLTRDVSCRRRQRKRHGWRGSQYLNGRCAVVETPHRASWRTATMGPYVFNSAQSY